MRIFNKKAQSTLEYAIIVAVVVGALLMMQIYVKRGLQGRLRSSTDSIGDQYSAGNVTSKYITEEEQSKTRERFGTGGGFSDTTDKGVTKTEIITAGEVTRKATGPTDTEKITQDLKDEDLFDEQGTLFDAE